MGRVKRGLVWGWEVEGWVVVDVGVGRGDWWLRPSQRETSEE